MSFNFRRDHEDQNSPKNWAAATSDKESVGKLPLLRTPKSMSTQELAALIFELGREGSLNPQQVKILSQLPELDLSVTADNASAAE